MDTNTFEHRCAVAVGAIGTILWFLGYGLYLKSTVGLGNLLGLPPVELAQIVFVVFTFPILLWLVISYVMRGRDLERQTTAIEYQLEMLTYANPSAEQRVHSIAESLRRQTIELRAATEDAAEAMNAIQARFRDQATDLESAARAAQAQAQEIDEALDVQKRTLGDMSEMLAQQKSTLAQASADQAENLEITARKSVDR